METSPANWLSEMGMAADSTFLHQLYDQLDPISYSPHDDFYFQPFTPCNQANLKNNIPEAIQGSHNYTPYIENYCDHEIIYEKPLKTQICDPTLMHNINPKASTSPSCASPVISFDFSNSDSQYGSPTQGQGIKRKNSGAARSPSLAKEHVLAERKRREKLSQRMIALSALLPGLKKADKASILEDAIKYLRQLQGRVKMLEEQRETNKKMESAISLRKLQTCIDTATSDSDDNSDDERQEPLPVIEAKVSNGDVLVRIHCEKRKNCTVKILGALERFNLSVINSVVLPFGDSTLDVTILAKMEEDLPMTVKDLVETLRLELLHTM